MKQLIKKLFVPNERKLCRLKGGPAKGMYMNLDLLHQSQRLWGLDERELFRPIKQLIAGCESLIDVGANDGYYTMTFLRSTAKRVVACEPGTAMDLLLLNAQVNGYQPDDRFTIERKMIGLDTGHVSLTELIKDLPRPIFIKVDIDGGEVDLLHSAESYSFLSDIRWIIETHSVELENECIQWLQMRGYYTKVIHNALWRFIVPEYRPIPHNRWLTAVGLPQS